MIQENYEESLKGYVNIVSMNLVPKMAMFDQLSISLESGCPQIEKQPLIFYLFDSIQIDVFLILAKLVDGTRSDKNILRFIDFCESNRKVITWKSGQITQDLITNHRNKISNVQNTIEKIKKRRDKYIAHLDKDYFLDINKLNEDFPIDREEMKDLTRCFQQILADHCQGLEGIIPVSIDGFFNIAMDNLLRKLCDN